MEHLHLNPDDADPDDLEPGYEDDPDELTAELVAYLDGELDQRGNEAIGAKLTLDASVRAEADAFKKTWDLLDHLPRPEPSTSFTERTLSRIIPLAQFGSATGPVISGSNNGVAASRGSTSSTPATLSFPPKSFRSRILVATAWLLVLVAAGCTGFVVRGQVMDRLNRIEQQEKDARILSDRRLLQNLSLYRNVDDLAFLKNLDDPDLFGAEHTGATNDGGAK